MRKFARYIIKKFNDINIKDKLILSYVFVVFLPVLVVGMRLTTGLRQLALDQAINQAAVNVERIRNMSEGILRVPTDISNKIFIDKALEDIITERYQSTWDVVKTYREYSDFNDYIRLYKEISNIRLYTTNETLLENWNFLKVNRQIESSQWYREALNNKGKIVWNYISDETRNGANYLSLTRVIKNSSYNTIGVLVIDVNTDYLNSMLDAEPFDTMIISSKGYIVAAKDASLIGKKASELKLGENFLARDKGILEHAYRGKPSKIIVDSFSPAYSKNSLKIVSIFPIESIVGEANRMSLLGLSVISISLLLSLVFIYIFSKALGDRVKRLSVQMRKVASGNFDVFTSIEGQDEIGQLSGDLNMMVRGIKDLMHEVYEVNLQKKQMELKHKEIKLKMLANQINPHFLFNALETIRMKAHCKGESEIAYIVKLLGKLIRRNLEIGNDSVTIASEIELIRSYLEIQKFRFGDKINYEVITDDNISEYRVLPLIIQPIVENAVIHGLEGKEDAGTIVVDFKVIGDLLKVSVIDDGVGMSSERLEYVVKTLEEIEDEAGTRIGLRNVHQRLKLHYGEKYGLRISSEPGRGTKVDALLPLRGGLYA